MEMKLDHEIYLDLKQTMRFREEDDDHKQRKAENLRILLFLLMGALDLVWRNPSLQEKEVREMGLGREERDKYRLQWEGS